MSDPVPPDIWWQANANSAVVFQNLSNAAKKFTGLVPWEMYSEHPHNWVLRLLSIRDFLNDILSLPEESLHFTAIESMRNRYPVISKAHRGVAALREYDRLHKNFSHLAWDDVENLSKYLISEVESIHNLRHLEQGEVMSKRGEDDLETE
ncbi:hypothetical protein [Deinococcus sp.]|uniref:hypothetical protein n=1 Tax=Deinococcus sp. TaxID=47478 RepID=UPI003C7B6CE1